MKVRTLFATALVAAFAGACAGDPDPFGTLDADADDRLSANEFAVGAADAGYYYDWDTDRDGLLNDPELRAGFSQAGIQVGYWADVWDLDKDGYLDEDELYEGAFDELDEDDDDYLDRYEFEAGVVEMI